MQRFAATCGQPVGRPAPYSLARYNVFDGVTEQSERAKSSTSGDKTHTATLVKIGCADWTSVCRKDGNSVVSLFQFRYDMYSICTADFVAVEQRM